MTLGRMQPTEMLILSNLNRERMTDGASGIYLFTVDLQRNAVTVAVCQTRLAYCRKHSAVNVPLSEQHQQHKLTHTESTMPRGPSAHFRHHRFYQHRKQWYVPNGYVTSFSASRRLFSATSDVVSSANDGMKYRQSVNEIMTAIHHSGKHQNFTTDKRTPLMTQLTAQYKHQITSVRCAVSACNQEVWV